MHNKKVSICYKLNWLNPISVFDMGFFEPSVMAEGGHMRGPHHNFVVFALMIIKFGTAVKLDVFYTMIAKSL